MRKVRRFFNHYKNTRLLMFQKIKNKLLQYGYESSNDNFDVEFRINGKFYFIELIGEQIRLFDGDYFDYYFDDVKSMFNKIKELRDKEI